FQGDHALAALLSVSWSPSRRWGERALLQASSLRSSYKYDDGISKRARLSGGWVRGTRGLAKPNRHPQPSLRTLLYPTGPTLPF
ncbi:hypothetical protein JMJ77_0011306, partial [Colletotrichum scovillei]